MKERKIVYALIIAFAISFATSYYLRIPEDKLGVEIINYWRTTTGNAGDINDLASFIKQAISLGVFLTVIILTVISMEYRYYGTFLGISLITMLGTAPPQSLISGVEWNLIMFLIGSMTLAFILRTLGVFEYIAIRILEFSKGSVKKLLFTILLFSWFLAMIVDEATSIVYVTLLIFEIKRLSRHDVMPLAILSVLATNIGSMALPVGNPIGIYISFTAHLSVSDFFLRALPLSLLLLLITFAIVYYLNKSYLNDLALKLDPERIEKRMEAYYSNIRGEELVKVKIGLALTVLFLFTISLADFLAEALTRFSGNAVEAHSLLSFIPYAFILLAGLLYGPQRLEKAIIRGVEWASILFFISLFMLGFSLLYTGIASKLAYVTIKLSDVAGNNYARFLVEVILVFSALLSSALDNLSVIVALTPIAKTVEAVFSTKKIYWSMLYGGVLGGNFTPVGSTANIVAIGLLSREKISVSWSNWFKIAAIPTLVQVLMAAFWLYMFPA
ncbi:MAG: SLC13 family permease [Desulfurococcaceae archaeon]